MDKIAALRAYDGKRMRFRWEEGGGAEREIEGVVTIRTVDGNERVYIRSNDGLEIYINVSEMEVN